MDRRRSDNYRYYTRRIWGRAQNYDLTVNTEIGTEAVQNIKRGRQSGVNMPEQPAVSYYFSLFPSENAVPAFPPTLR